MCAAADDGIVLTARRGATPGEVILSWTGGAPFFEVFRSTNPAVVVDPSRKLGETPDRAWTDPPPPGNIFFYVVTGGLDRFPPGITASISPAPNANGWNNSDVTVSFTCTDVGSGIATCPAPQVLGAEGANQVVSGTAIDQAGNSATATVSVSIDKTSPLLTITAPIEPIIYADPSPSVGVAYVDPLSGTDPTSLQILIDGVPLSACQVGGSGASCEPPPLEAGTRLLSAEIVDRAGNGSAAARHFEISEAVPLDIRILAPANGLLTREGSMEVSGTVSELAEAVAVNGVQALLSSGSFSASGVPLVEGNNTLTAVARNSTRGVGSASVTVVRDTSPPSIAIEAPAAGQTVHSATVTIVGLVNDVVTGTVNAEDCRVVVSGRAGSRTAVISNRTFLIPDFPLVPGPNVLTAVATDAAGNVSAPVEVILGRESPVGQRIEVAAGNHQSGPIGSVLSQPLVALLKNASGAPVAGRSVTFTVERGDGSLTGGQEVGRSATILSDEQGRAAVVFTLGTRSGVGNQRVAARATGFVGEALFVASAVAGPAIEIKTFTGDLQTGAAGRALPDPFVVFVHDFGSNPVAGVPVTFRVARGGGSIGGNESIVVLTDGDGRARITLTLGREPGIANNLVEAVIPEQVGLPALLTASALAIGPAELTRVSGVVLDNSNVPVPGATIRISGTTLTASSDEQGRFTIAGAPVGTIGFEVDARTTPRPGTWPDLHFMMTTVSGQDNTLGMPVYVLTIDTPSARLVGGASDVTLSMSNVEGVSLTIFANSVTCVDGSNQCMVSISQVHNDKVPMPPLGGDSPRLIWTVQPPGTRFDPPARVTYPNLDGLAAGSVVEVMSFDHDLGQYVSVGTASVSEDGSVITSDPGSGITHAGWGYPSCRRKRTTCGQPPCTPSGDPDPKDCKIPVGGDSCGEGCSIENRPDDSYCGEREEYGIVRSKCKFCRSGSCEFGPKQPLGPDPCDQPEGLDLYECLVNNVFRRFTGMDANVTHRTDGRHSGTDNVKSGCDVGEAGTSEETCVPVSHSWHYCGRALDLTSKDKCDELSDFLAAQIRNIRPRVGASIHGRSTDEAHLHVSFQHPDSRVLCWSGELCGASDLGLPACRDCSWVALAPGEEAPASACRVSFFGGRSNYLRCTPDCPP